MTIEVARFDVSAVRNAKAGANHLGWKVLIHVRFASDDPKNWGELRAFGGAWRRKINRTVVKTGVRSDTTSQLLAPLGADQFDIEEAHLGLSRQLPFWGHAETPTGLQGKDVRLGNDQHIEIFYSQSVPGIPRSDPTMPTPREHKKWEADPLLDAMEPDEPEKADDPWEIDSPLWHIIGRDEPEWSGAFQAGDYVDYWHQAEFQIRPPASMRVLARKRLFLRITGRYPNYEYGQWPD
jgi:hypothetical protein